MPMVTHQFHRAMPVDHTVSAADVGGMNRVNPPSTQSRFRNIVAGLGAR